MYSLAKQVGVKTLQVLNWVFFAAMVTVNYLANALPINGKSTGELSKQYPNLFVPAPVTFSIWGVIYSLLIVFCIYQSRGLFSKTPHAVTNAIVDNIGFGFIGTCVFNILWIGVWHYEYLFLSIIVMALFLAQLIDLNRRLSYLGKSKINVPVAIRAAFGSYLGWICVAIIANVTAALVFFGWNSFGQSEVFWACLMIVVGGGIVSYTLTKFNNIFIGVSVVWAFIGIIIARNQAVEYQRYIVWVAVVGIVIVTVSLLATFRKSTQQVR